MTQFYGTLTPEKTEREEKNMQLVRKGAGECMVFIFLITLTYIFPYELNQLLGRRG